MCDRVEKRCEGGGELSRRLHLARVAHAWQPYEPGARDCLGQAPAALDRDHAVGFPPDHQRWYPQGPVRRRRKGARLWAEDGELPGVGTLHLKPQVLAERRWHAARVSEDFVHHRIYRGGRSRVTWRGLASSRHACVPSRLLVLRHRPTGTV